LTRVLTESRAKKIFADVIQTWIQHDIFNRRGTGPLHAGKPIRLPNESKKRIWDDGLLQRLRDRYNTRLVRRAPCRNLNDALLDFPKWKGALRWRAPRRIGFAACADHGPGSAGPKIYARRSPTAATKPRARRHEILAQLIVAGEGLFDINIPAASVRRE